MGIEKIPELNEWYDRLTVERHGWQAYAIGEALLKKTFQRLREGHGPFPHERMTAFACGVTPCVYQRRRAKFAAFFAFIDDQITRAWERLTGRKQSKKPIVFSGEKSTKSKADPALDNTPTSRNGPSGHSVEGRRDEKPRAARSAGGCAPASAQTPELERRAQSATPDPAQPLDDWPATPEDLASAKSKFPNEAAVAAFKIRVRDHCHAHRIPVTASEYRFRLECGWPDECDAA